MEGLNRQSSNETEGNSNEGSDDSDNPEVRSDGFMSNLLEKLPGNQLIISLIRSRSHLSFLILGMEGLNRQLNETDEAVAAVDARFYGEYSAAYRALVATARPQLDADELDRRVTAVIAMSNGVWLNWARFGRRADLDDGLARCDAIALA